MLTLNLEKKRRKKLGWKNWHASRKKNKDGEKSKPKLLIRHKIKKGLELFFSRGILT